MANDLSPATIERPKSLPAAIQAGDRVPMMNFGGSFMIQPQSVGELVEVAKLMAAAGPMVGKAVRDKPGACLAIILQAGRCGMDPFALSLKTYLVNDQIAYEAQAIAAMIYNSPVLDGRLDYEYEGSGDSLICTVRGRIKGESKERVYTSPRKGDIKTQNSPLWKADPQQQLGYFSARAWARRHVPDVIMGVYSRDEVETMPADQDGFVNVTPERADPVARLKQNLAAGRAAHNDPEPEDDPPSPASALAAPEPEAEAEDDRPAQANVSPSQDAESEAASAKGEAALSSDSQAEKQASADPAMPPHPGELKRTNAGALQWARDWAAYWRSLATRAEEDAFLEQTEAATSLAKALNPEAVDIIDDAFNTPKDLV